MTAGSRGGPARPIGDLLGGALRALGVPSKAVTKRVLSAWERVADPAWRGVAMPHRWTAGTLVVAVASAPLRQELAQFHAERLLAALKSLLPDDPITALRFEAAGEGSR